MDTILKQYRIVVDKADCGDVLINDMLPPQDDPQRVFWLKIYSFGAVPGDMLEITGRATESNGLVVEMRTYGNAQAGLQIIPRRAEAGRRPVLPWTIRR